MDTKHFIAFDLGATSGRTILGTLSENRLTLEEVTRFPNQMLQLNGHYYWNIFSLYENLKKGLAAVAQKKIPVTSAGIDTWGVDFVVGVDGRGHITEGPTENVGIVSKGGVLAFPPLDSVLAGTTMLRVAELAQPLEAGGAIKGVVFRPIRVEELAEAREILVVGTTLNVASAVEWEGRPVGDGRPGPIARELDARIARDCRENPALRTAYL